MNLLQITLNFLVWTATKSLKVTVHYNNHIWVEKRERKVTRVTLYMTAGSNPVGKRHKHWVTRLPPLWSRWRYLTGRSKRCKQLQKQFPAPQQTAYRGETGSLPS